MIELLFIGAIGLAAVGMMLDGDDDPAIEDPQPGDEGIELAFDGSTALIGTEGNDILPLGQDPDLAPDTIDLLGGDDTATIGQTSDITINGGEGDDTLSNLGGQNVLDGGPGDDTLYGFSGAVFEGGTGDDTITFDSDVTLDSTTARIDGGPGDDMIELRADAGVDNPDRGGAIVVGGEGADTFDIVLELKSSQLVLDGVDETLEASSASIRDFDPDVDMISIEIEPDEDNTDRRIEDILFDQKEDGDQFQTVIQIIFEETDTAFQAITDVRITSEKPFDLSDVTFVNARFV